jgi:uncharacterized protein involved in exopolysaccharide biosynthesis
VTDAFGDGVTMTEERALVPAGPPAGTEDGVSLLWVAAVLLRNRRLIATIATVGIVLALVIVVLRPKTYTTTFSFLPQTTQDPSRAGLSSLAGQFGITLGSLGGAQESPQLYADLLTTREVLGPIAADSFFVEADRGARTPLAQFLVVPAGQPQVVAEQTLRKLRTDVIATSVAQRTTGMVTVSVRTKSRYVSLAIAQRLLEGLNHFNLITRQSQAREERRFTEQRLSDARASLRAAEDALQQFLQNNRNFNEAAALRFQQDRLQREVQLQQQVVTSLAQQYEENRIREVRDTPVITVIESPILAAMPDARHRALIIFLGAVGAFGIGVLAVIARETWRRERAEGHDPALPMLANEWKRLRGVAAS